MIVINVKEKTLLKDKKTYKISPKEMKLLLLLSDNETHSRDEILKYLNISYSNFHDLKTALYDKFFIGLHLRYGFGYRITNEIFKNK